MSAIRLGIIRCDTHAYWYAPFMAKCDPFKLRERRCYVHRDLASIWDPARLSVHPEPGFRLVKVYDADPKTAEAFADTFTDKPSVCSRVEEMTTGVDAVFIACCSLDGEEHRRWSEPVLRKKIPLFVDKPLASTWRDAKAIVAMAEKYRTPLFSTSLLTHAEDTRMLVRRIGELGAGRLALAFGASGWRSKTGLEGISHSVALALATFGRGVDWVECMGDMPREFLLMHYPDGRKILAISSLPEVRNAMFRVDVLGPSKGPDRSFWRRNTVASEGDLDPALLQAGVRVVKLFKKMVLTRQPPVPYDQLLEWPKVMEAGLRAQKSGKRVWLKDIR